VTDRDPVLAKIDTYYSGKLRDFGPTPRGVDWNSEEAQVVRFEQIARVLPDDRPFSIIDFGCGYGAFADFLDARGYDAHYTGFDVSAEMIAAARARLGSGVALTSLATDLSPADFVVASGIFSVRMDVEIDVWEHYIHTTIDQMDSLAMRGMSFNLLTAYSDPERKRADLYYADPHYYFDFCRQRYSRWVALLHDYGIYEFTLIVRKP
jgi:SAM-dependent methyltransferase